MTVWRLVRRAGRGVGGAVCAVRRGLRPTISKWLSNYLTIAQNTLARASARLSGR